MDNLKEQQSNFKLEEMCENHPIKILTIGGENATFKMYGWLKSNKEYDWLSLRDVVSFPTVNDIDGNKLIQMFIDYIKKQVPEKSYGHNREHYQDIDLLFNTFLYTSARKPFNEVSDKELYEPNGFFDTHIIHTPDFGTLDLKAKSVLLNGENDNLLTKFDGLLKVQGDRGVGWTICEFKEFNKSQLNDLFGSKYYLLKERFTDSSNPRGNYFQGDFPYDYFGDIFSPLSLTEQSRGLSLETFPFFNNDGIHNPAWYERKVLFPVIKSG